MAGITREEYAVFTRLIREISGIVLDDSKAYLVEARLGSLLVELKLSSFGELYYRIRNDSSGNLKQRVIDRMTTQETSFFRDSAPFEMLKFKILPDLIDARRRQFPSLGKTPIRIWSTACSTGQEIYSIGIALKEVLGELSGYSIHILGTDISDAAIAKASYGHYSSFEIGRGLSPDLLDKYFTRKGDAYRISDEIRALVSFRRLNLHEDFGSLGRWDIVFCRNVAIYFGDKDKQSLFDRILKVLEADGYLVIGSTESLLGTCPNFEAKRHLRSVFYQPKTVAPSVGSLICPVKD
jgi:chemotaxis protein methyltransferase CheR